jgi:hypothetical protein
MGRHKIDASTRIVDDKKRKSTEKSREWGLDKKAVELSRLCGTEVLLITRTTDGAIKVISSHEDPIEHIDQLRDMLLEQDRSVQLFDIERGIRHFKERAIVYEDPKKRFNNLSKRDKNNKYKSKKYDDDDVDHDHLRDHEGSIHIESISKRIKKTSRLEGQQEDREQMDQLVSQNINEVITFYLKKQAMQISQTQMIQDDNYQSIYNQDNMSSYGVHNNQITDNGQQASYNVQTSSNQFMPKDQIQSFDQETQNDFLTRVESPNLEDVNIPDFLKTAYQSQMEECMRQISTFKEDDPEDKETICNIIGSWVARNGMQKNDVVHDTIEENMNYIVSNPVQTHLDNLSITNLNQQIETSTSFATDIRSLSNRTITIETTQTVQMKNTTTIQYDEFLQKLQQLANEF